eukprot:111397-Hanusia_phi.AAC.1
MAESVYLTSGGRAERGEGRCFTGCGARAADQGQGEISRSSCRGEERLVWAQPAVSYKVVVAQGGEGGAAE